MWTLGSFVEGQSTCVSLRPVPRDGGKKPFPLIQMKSLLLLFQKLQQHHVQNSSVTGESWTSLFKPGLDAI